MKILTTIIILLSTITSYAQTRYSIPTKVWAYGVNNAPTYNDIKNTIQNLNKLNSIAQTGFSYYLSDVEFVKKKKFDNMGFASQMPWQSITRHDKNMLNIAIVGALSKSGDHKKGQGRTGVCFNLTGSVVVTKGEDMSVVTHEVGHFLGLKHQLDLPDNIMSYNPDKSKRRVFTAQQIQQMLNEAAKMKYSNIWKLAPNEPTPDEYEPDFSNDFATPIRNNQTQQHTFHRTTDSNGATSYDDADLMRFSFSKKTTLDNPRVIVESNYAQNITIQLLDTNLKLLTSTNSNTLNLSNITTGSYYIKIVNNPKKASSYSITLKLNNEE